MERRRRRFYEVNFILGLRTGDGNFFVCSKFNIMNFRKKDIQWFSNEQVWEMINGEGYTSTELKYASEELERRLKLSGFFEMPLEFYLRELPEYSFDFKNGVCRCYSILTDREFFGKTALEAAKAAYKWKIAQ